MPNHSGLVTSSQANCDGVALEVVAEAEVAQHLEEGVVAAGEAHIFEVVVLAAGADAFLRSGGAGVVALLGAKKEILELVHARVGKQQRGIVGGTSEEECTRRCPFDSKKRRNSSRISFPVRNLHDSFSVTACGAAHAALAR